MKSYNQPRRNSVSRSFRQRAIDVEVVPEGGSTFYHNMTMIIDGHATVEHNIPISPVYKDLMTLSSNSTNRLHANIDCELRRSFR